MIVYLDTETTGLDPLLDRLVLVGVAIDNRQPRALSHPADRELIERYLGADALFVGHNINFDMSFLEAAGYRIPAPERWDDTVLISHVAGERLPGQTALRRLTKRLIEADVLPEAILEPEDAVNAWLRAARRQARKDNRPRRPEKGDAPARLLNPYLQADVIATRAAHAHYGASINGQGGVLQLERRCMPAIYAAERRGVPLDLEAAAELRDRTEVGVGDLRARLFDLAGHAFNPNAARQVEKALLERGADLSVVPRTPKADMPMFTTDTLPAIGDELADALLAYRTEKKLHDYVLGLWKHAHGDRLYGGFRQMGTDTGRMSSANPNLQNIPKSDLRVRYTICAGEGMALVGADLDNVELRVLAAFAPGGALEQAFADGVDLHQQTADAVGVDRDGGKTLNYAILYGAGAPRVAKQLGIEAGAAKAILDRWYATYPEVGRLKAKLTRAVRECGYLTSVGGRRHVFDQPNHMLLNRLISGSCADLFKASIIELHELGVPIVLLVHDEVVAEVPVDRAEETGKQLETALARGAEGIGGLVAEASSAQRWSQFKDPEWTP